MTDPRTIADAGPIARLRAERVSTLRREAGRIAEVAAPAVITRAPRPPLVPVGPAMPAAPAAPAPIAVPPMSAVGDNPFDTLPQPSPGDRIKADDFKKLSQALGLVQQMTVLAGALFGRSLGEARVALAAQQYVIERIVTVFGNDVTAADTSLDGRRVVQVSPMKLGERRLLVVVSETVEVTRLMPDLTRLSYGEANAQIRVLMGGAAVSRTPIAAPSLVGGTLATVRTTLNS